MKKEAGVFTSGTSKNLRTHTPEVSGEAKKGMVHQNGEKGEPFTSSNKKRLNKEIKAQSHPSVAKGKIQGEIYDKDPFTYCTQKRQSDRMGGANPHVKSISKTGRNDFHSDTTVEAGAVMDSSAKGSN